jgi:hypothetical protein
MKGIVAGLTLICAFPGLVNAQRIPNLGKLFRLQAALAIESKREENYGLAQKSNIENLKVAVNMFNVALLNDSIITIKGRIDFQQFPNRLIEIGKNGRIFTLTDTQFISTLWEGGQESIGVPGDSTWLFRVSSNNINLYASVPYYVWDCVVALQKGEDGALMPLNEENLEYVLSDNQNAISFFDDGRIEDSISVYNGAWVDKNRRKKGTYSWPDPNRRTR